MLVALAFAKWRITKLRREWLTGNKLRRGIGKSNQFVVV
jgi:hypothetical protein